MTVLDIVRDYLTEHGYDGLCNDGCACEISDLAPCDSTCNDCEPGMKEPCDCGGGCRFHIVAREPRPTASPIATALALRAQDESEGGDWSRCESCRHARGDECQYEDPAETCAKMGWALWEQDEDHVAELLAMLRNGDVHRRKAIEHAEALIAERDKLRHSFDLIAADRDRVIAERDAALQANVGLSKLHVDILEEIDSLKGQLDRAQAYLLASRCKDDDCPPGIEIEDSPYICDSCPVGFALADEPVSGESEGRKT